MFDDCGHKPEAELAGICGGALHLSRLVGAIRICLVSAGQKNLRFAAKSSEAWGADDRQPSAFAERG
jgi:hypothetical protein